MKDLQIMFDILRKMYLEAIPSVNFDELMEKAELNELGQKIIHFDNYFLSQKQQEEILEGVLKGKRFTNLKRQMIRNSIWLGPSPTTVDFYYELERENDPITKQSDRVRWVEFNKNAVFKQWYDNIAVGRSLVMSPFNAMFSWQTTPVTEIISQEDNAIKFKTKNSIYNLKRIRKNE